MKRKHISWKTRCAAAVYELDFLRMVHFGPGLAGQNTEIPLDLAKKMTEDEYLRLWEWHHETALYFRETNHFTVIRPLPVQAHRDRTKQDLKAIAKSKRIEKREIKHKLILAGLSEDPFPQERKIPSRGFDKRYRRKMDGTVVPRK